MCSGMRRASSRYCGAGRDGTLSCLFVHASAHARVRLRVRARVRACVAVRRFGEAMVASRSDAVNVVEVASAPKL